MLFVLPPEVAVQTVDYEIQAPSLAPVVEQIFGIQLDKEARVLTIAPQWPADWEHRDVAISTAEFDFSCVWCDEVCTWSYEAFGEYALQYDSIVVRLPQGVQVAGSLAATEGVLLDYQLPGSAEPEQPAKKEKKSFFKRRSKKSKTNKQK